MRDLVGAALEAEGYKAETFGDVATASAYLDRETPDMAILDLFLPDGSGNEVAEKIRGSAGTRSMPIIVLTGQEDLGSKVAAFAAGADHYLQKPLDMQELALWVKALFRRVELDSAVPAEKLRAGDLEVDPGPRLVSWRGRAVKGLTGREFDLLASLVEHSPSVVSREFIMKRVWRTCAVDNLVDTQLYNLRRKLPPQVSRNIQAVHGRGFRYLPS